MTQTKHTAGEWEVIEEDGFWYVVTDGFTIAQANEVDFDMRPEESLANARLIASAPELLEACKKGLKYARICSDGLGEKIDSDMIKMFEKVITKAEGSQP